MTHFRDETFTKKTGDCFHLAVNVVSEVAFFKSFISIRSKQSVSLFSHNFSIRQFLKAGRLVAVLQGKQVCLPLHITDCDLCGMPDLYNR